MLIILLLVDKILVILLLLLFNLITDRSLNLHAMLIVLLVVELGAVVEHQVQVGGRVALVHLEQHKSQQNIQDYQVQVELLWLT